MNTHLFAAQWSSARRNRALFKSASSLILFAGLVPGQMSAETRASASSGNPTAPVITNVEFKTAEAARKANLKLTLGTNIAGDASAGPVTSAAIPYFLSNNNGTPASRPATRLGVNGAGVATSGAGVDDLIVTSAVPAPTGSLARSGGQFSASVGANPATYSAQFELWALGHGTYKAEAKVEDPFYIMDDPEYHTTATMDLFLPVGLSGGLLGSSGEIGLTADLTWASGSTRVLDLLLTPSGLSLAGYAGASVYRLSAIDQNPATLLAGDLTTWSSVRDGLWADVKDDFVMNSPLLLGVWLEDVPVPTASFDGGALFSYGVSLRVLDAGAVPEPATWWSGLFAIGLVGTVWYRRRHLVKTASRAG